MIKFQFLLAIFFGFFALEAASAKNFIPEIANTTASINNKVLVSTRIFEGGGTLTSQNQTLRDGSHYQAFDLEIRSPSVITISLKSTEFDTYLIVNNSQGQKIAENDDWQVGKTDSQVTVYLPSAGTYKIIVAGYNARSLGRYYMTASQNVVTDSESFEVMKLMIRQMLNEDGMSNNLIRRIGPLHSVDNYALGSYFFLEGGGQALIKFQNGAMQIITASGGSLQDVEYLVQFGVPRPIAIELASGPDV